MAKHLKKNGGVKSYKLFSSKASSRSAQPETVLDDDVLIGDAQPPEFGFYVAPTELSFDSPANATQASADEEPPSPEQAVPPAAEPLTEESELEEPYTEETETEEPCTQVTEPKAKQPRRPQPQHSKSARVFSSRGGKKRSDKTFTANHSTPRIYVDKKAAIRLAAAAGVVVLAVILIILAVKFSHSPKSGGDATAEDYVFAPYSVDETDPDKLITETAVMVDEAETASYTAPSELTIDFPKASDYTSVAGVIGFQGNNFRDSAAYGCVAMKQNKFVSDWSVSTGSLKDADGNTWSGSGWTGQPLIVCWPETTKAHMASMYDSAREKTGLVEAIYPTMDGKIYFIDLETGEPTRDAMDLGFTFKGTGALDPRGYPILYVGSGVNSQAGKSRVFVINLLDCSIMYRFGYYEPFAQRDWNMWDASPLVDPATDQLIYPGENGLLYIIHLNTLYNEDAGALTVNPDKTVRWRYTSRRTTTYTFWSGMEASPVCFQGHIIMADNGGNLMCLDLNTLKLDWVQDVLDDTNCSPVLSLEKDGAYIYISTSFHPGWRDNASAAVPVWKINAVTGEKVWQTDYTCTGATGLCGGVQGTITLGKNKLSGMVFVPVAEIADTDGGKLVALDSKTGKQIWEYTTASYSWSSPVAVYDADGNGYIVYCTMDGSVYLLDGLTGKTLDCHVIDGTIEATPAVFNNYVMVGTRSGKIVGLQLG